MNNLLILLPLFIVILALFNGSILRTFAADSDAMCEDDEPLGMISGSITNAQITASSTYPSAWARGCETWNARLYQQNGYSWCPARKSATEWLQVDLGVLSRVTGVMTQGRSDGREWVTRFRLSYSTDGTKDRYITDAYGNQKIFDANIDSYSVKHNYLDEPVKARFIKFHIHSWNQHPSLRVEILGCQTCNNILGLPPYTRLSSSTAKRRKQAKSCVEEYGHIYSNKAWCAGKQDNKQYLELDIGPPTLITGIVTKGRGDGKNPQWVKKYTLSYSNTSVIWFYYRYNSTAFTTKVFDGNSDQHSSVTHYFNMPFVARFVRVHPVEWEYKIAMRAALIGCRHHGDCGPGFFRINNHSSCVPNLAYKKTAWLNTGMSRHRKRHSSFYGTNGGEEEENNGGGGGGQATVAGPEDVAASHAVDGSWLDLSLKSQKSDNSAAQVAAYVDDVVKKNCTVLEYKWPYTSLPTWYVDLRHSSRINGVIINTPGDPDRLKLEKTNVYVKRLDYLDRLSVYVSEEEQPQYADGNLNQFKKKLCGEVVRYNRAVYNARIHIPCEQPLQGRYLHIEARGVEGAWDKEFTAILCEVGVY